MKLIRTIPVALAVAALLSGCAGAAPTAAPTVTTHRPTAPTAAAVVHPAQAFGGDCANLFTAHELAVTVGIDVGGVAVTSLVVVPGAGHDTVEPRGAATVQAGGIECEWAYPSAGDAVSPAAVHATVTPAAPGTVSSSACDPNTMSGADCAFSVETSGYLLSVDLTKSVPDAEPGAVAASASRLSALFAVKAVQAGTAPSPVPAAGAWTAADTNCDALAANRAVIAAFHDSSLVGGPADDSMAAPGTESTGYAACTWSNVDSTFLSMQILPGGAWAEADVAAEPGAVKTSTPGFTDTWTVGDTVNIFDGVNWIQVSSWDSAKTKVAALAGAAAIVKELNAS